MTEGVSCILFRQLVSSLTDKQDWLSVNRITLALYV